MTLRERETVFKLSKSRITETFKTQVKLTLRLILINDVQAMLGERFSLVKCTWLHCKSRIVWFSSKVHRYIPITYLHHTLLYELRKYFRAVFDNSPTLTCSYCHMFCRQSHKLDHKPVYMRRDSLEINKNFVYSKHSDCIVLACRSDLYIEYLVM